MALLDLKRGQTSVVLRVKLLASNVTTGAGLTGLTSSSAGLLISTIADNEATATVYAQASSNIETITTLGTYAAPTASKCRFKEVDATNHKGIFELQFADARFAVSNAKSLLVSISGATNLAETDFVIPLQDFNPYDVVRGGLTALPNVASGSAGAIITSGTGTAQLSVTSGRAAADATHINGVAATSVTTISANLGTTQPINFTGTGASATAKSDLVNIAGAAVSTTTAQLGVNAVQISGDGTAADNCELFFDGTGYAASNSTVGTVTTLTNKTGFSLTQAFPTNFADLAITATTGRVTAGTVSDKTGYSLSQSFPTNFASLVISAGGIVDANVAEVDGIAVSMPDRGTAQAGAASTITLASGASATDNIYNDRTITIDGGTGVGQSRVITGYVGSTKVATVDRAWTTNPSSSSTYTIGDTTTVARLTTQSKADVNAEADTALSDYGALKPTTAGRTLDVTATGEAGIDWANIGGPTTTVNLSGTTVKTATDVETDTADIQSRLPSALVSGRMSSDAVAIGGSTVAVTSLIAQMLAFVTGSVNDASATTTSFVGDSGLSATDDFYTGLVISPTSGTLKGIARAVSNYVGSSKTFTVSEAWPSAPANGVTFILIGKGGSSA